MEFPVLLQGSMQTLFGGQLQHQTQVRTRSDSTQVGQVGVVKVGEEGHLLPDLSVGIEDMLGFL